MFKNGGNIKAVEAERSMVVKHCNKACKACLCATALKEAICPAKRHTFSK